MKMLPVLGLLLLGSVVSAQVSVKPVEQEIAKVKRTGYVTTSSVAEKIIEEAWKKKLSQYGRVLSERGGVYKVEYAKVPFYDKNVLIVSQLDTRRGSTSIFMSVDLGNYEYASSTNNYGREVEDILRDFHKDIDYQSQVAEADKGLKEASDKQREVVRKSDRNLRNLKDNHSEKIKLLKRLEDNEKELIQLRADSVQLYSDVQQVNQQLEDQKKNVDTVKNRKP